MKIKKYYKGQSLVELLLTIGIAAILFPALATVFIASREGKPQLIQRTQAIALAKETESAVESIRNNDWTTFAVNGTYHTSLSGSQWTLAGGTTVINGFTQQVVISDVYRDSNGAIVTSGGTLDPSTKKVDVTISWSQPYSSSIDTITYLTRTGNLTKLYNLTTDFSPGTTTGTSVVSTTGSSTPNDGQVQLNAGGGGGDWCQPSKSITTVDLPKSGVANAVTAIEGTVFAGTGDNSSGVSFAKVNITTTQDPPPATITGTFDGYKTNAVFGESNYAYLGTDNNSEEVVIMSLTQYSDPPTNSKFLKVGAINLPGNLNTNSIYVVNNKAYITASNGKLYIYDITTRSSPSLLNSTGLTLDGVGKKILVTGNYAYIATGSTTKQVDIVNISNASSPSIAGSLQLGTGQSGVDVYINTSNTSPTRAYLVTSTAAGKNDFYIVNIATPASPTISGLSSYNTGGMTPTGVTVVTGNRAIIVGTGGTYQYQVIDISNETSTLSACANLAYATGVYGVASVLQSNGYAYSYIITGDASSELKIILGGAGGQYTSSGTYESPTFDPSTIDGITTDRAFNRLVATVSQPSQTTLQMQVSVASAVSGSCTNAVFSYVGPDGTASTYFTPSSGTITASIPIGNYGTSYRNPGRCFRYKTWFTSTDSGQTPVLYDVSLNYSL